MRICRARVADGLMSDVPVVSTTDSNFVKSSWPRSNPSVPIFTKQAAETLAPLLHAIVAFGRCPSRDAVDEVASSCVVNGYYLLE